MFVSPRFQKLRGLKLIERRNTRLKHQSEQFVRERIPTKGGGALTSLPKPKPKHSCLDSSSIPHSCSSPRLNSSPRCNSTSRLDSSPHLDSKSAYATITHATANAESQRCKVAVAVTKYSQMSKCQNAKLSKYRNVKTTRCQKYGSFHFVNATSIK